MPQNVPTRIAQVIKDEINDQVTWSVYIYTADEWEVYRNSEVVGEAKFIDVFSGMDETTALSRARMCYPAYVIGENQDGYTKEWR